MIFLCFVWIAEAIRGDRVTVYKFTDVEGSEFLTKKYKWNSGDTTQDEVELSQWSRSIWIGKSIFEERIEDFYETMVRVHESYLKKKSELKDKKTDID